MAMRFEKNVHDKDVIFIWSLFMYTCRTMCLYVCACLHTCVKFYIAVSHITF